MTDFHFDFDSRNKKIYEARELQKKVFWKIGKEFDLTTERVRQICAREKRKRDKAVKAASEDIAKATEYIYKILP